MRLAGIGKCTWAWPGASGAQHALGLGFYGGVGRPCDPAYGETTNKLPRNSPRNPPGTAPELGPQTMFRLKTPELSLLGRKMSTIRNINRKLLP